MAPLVFTDSFDTISASWDPFPGGTAEDSGITADGWLNITLSGAYDYGGISYPSPAVADVGAWTGYDAHFASFSSVSFRVQLPTITGGDPTMFSVGVAEAGASVARGFGVIFSHNGAGITPDPGDGGFTVAFNLTIDGVPTSSQTHPWDATKPWYRISETGADLVLARSADGSSWTTVETVTPAAQTLDQITLQILANVGETFTAAHTYKLDDLNYVYAGGETGPEPETPTVVSGGTVHIWDDEKLWALDADTGAVKASIGTKDVTPNFMMTYGTDGQIYIANNTRPWLGPATDEYMRALWIAIDSTCTNVTAGPSWPESNLDPGVEDLINETYGYGFTGAGLFFPAVAESSEPHKMGVVRFPNPYVFEAELRTYTSPEWDPFSIVSDGQYLYWTDVYWVIKYDTFTGDYEVLLDQKEALGECRIFSLAKREKDGMIYFHGMDDWSTNDLDPKDTAYRIYRINDGKLEKLYEAMPVIDPEDETRIQTMWPELGSAHIAEPYMFFVAACRQALTGFRDRWAVVRYNMDTNTLDRKWYTTQASNPDEYLYVAGQGGYDKPTLRGSIRSTRRWFR